MSDRDSGTDEVSTFENEPTCNAPDEQGLFRLSRISRMTTNLDHKSHRVDVARRFNPAASNCSTVTPVTGIPVPAGFDGSGT
jgi:hypothetical protein